MTVSPYKTTPEFDEGSLPDAIRNDHSTKAGVWGLLVVLEGRVRLVFHDPVGTVDVEPGKPGLIPPQAVHHVETSGPMRMRVEFYRENPLT
ncbi:MAG: DUF1971 domain-containing protein [Novosphingobium sp.]|nr:DUF1971 domain-containing protein [Novosphingobium sp.]